MSCDGLNATSQEEQGENGDDVARMGTRWQNRAALLEDLFETTSDLIQIFGVDGTLRLVNRAWCERMGYTEAEAIGRNVFDLIAPDCREQCQQVFGALLSGQSPQTIECAFINRHGRRLSLEGQVNVLFLAGVPVEVRGIFRDVSERKEAAEALQNLNTRLEERVRQRTRELELTQARLEEAQSLAVVGHWEMDLVHGDLHWSDEICRICGFDPETITPSYALFIEIVHPEDRPLLDSVYRQSMLSGQPCDLRYRLLLQDGSVRHIHARWITDLDADGRPIRSLGTSQDVTDFERAQRELLESEAKLRSLFDSSPLGLVLMEGGDRCSLVNAAFERISGLRSGPLQGKLQSDPADQGDPSCRPLQDLFQVGREALAGRNADTVIHHWQRPDGTSVAVQLRANGVPAVGDAAGSSMAWVQVEDIGSRLEAEDRLRLAARVFHSAAEGIFLTDPAGVIVDVNEALCRITGYGRHEMVGQTPRLFKSGLHSSDFYRQMWDSLEREGIWSGEIINRSRDGAAQDMLETISIVRDDQGAVANYVALLTDIRQLKTQQRQLERLALYDSLTGLPNRVLLAQAMERDIEAVQRTGGCIVVCYLDLDGFKQINDRHGHAAGDSLLQTLAQRMQQVLSPRDLVARLGGDEFVAVLHGIHVGQQRLPLLDRLLRVLVEPVAWNDQMLEITASIGVVFYSGDSGVLAPDQLLCSADQAMYAAKRQGKNRYCLASDTSAR